MPKYLKTLLILHLIGDGCVGIYQFYMITISSQLNNTGLVLLIYAVLLLAFGVYLGCKLAFDKVNYRGLYTFLILTMPLIKTSVISYSLEYGISALNFSINRNGYSIGINFISLIFLFLLRKQQQLEKQSN